MVKKKGDQDVTLGRVSAYSAAGLRSTLLGQPIEIFFIVTSNKDCDIYYPVE